MRVAYESPVIVVNPQNKEYSDGYKACIAGCWWRGCPYCHETQEFADWQAGWHKAYDE